MDPELRDLIDALPTGVPRSKLEPHAEVITKLRKKRLTYKAIAAFFKANLHIEVAPSTIHFFVKRRSRKPAMSDPPELELQLSLPVPRTREATPRTAFSPADAEAARARIRFLKNEEVPVAPPSRRFHYDPEEPLSLDQHKDK